MRTTAPELGPFGVPIEKETAPKPKIKKKSPIYYIVEEELEEEEDSGAYKRPDYTK